MHGLKFLTVYLCSIAILLSAIYLMCCLIGLF